MFLNFLKFIFLLILFILEYYIFFYIYLFYHAFSIFLILFLLFFLSNQYQEEHSLVLCLNCLTIFQMHYERNFSKGCLMIFWMHCVLTSYSYPSVQYYNIQIYSKIFYVEFIFCLMIKFVNRNYFSMSLMLNSDIIY